MQSRFSSESCHRKRMKKILVGSSNAHKYYIAVCLQKITKDPKNARKRLLAPSNYGGVANRFPLMFPKLFEDSVASATTADDDTGNRVFRHGWVLRGHHHCVAACCLLYFFHHHVFSRKHVPLLSPWNAQDLVRSQICKPNSQGVRVFLWRCTMKWCIEMLPQTITCSKCPWFSTKPCHRSTFFCWNAGEWHPTIPHTSGATRTASHRAGSKTAAHGWSGYFVRLELTIVLWEKKERTKCVFFLGKPA